MKKLQRLTINVSGLMFETTDQCLQRYPNTLLGNPRKRMRYYVPHENMYFFDRHRLAFEGILMFYQCYGRIVCPDNVPDEVFQAELEFFKIDCEFLRAAQEAKKYVFDRVAVKEIGDSYQERIWNLLQNPGSSTGAQVLSTMSLLMTLTSIILACLNPGDHNNKETRVHHDLFPLEMSCFVWFTLEYGTRLWACPSKIDFLKSWIDTTDLLTLVVFYSSLALTSTQASSTSILKVFRLANAFRVFRLTRFSNGLRLLIYTIYKSRTDLQLLSGFFAFFILITGSMVYFAESGNEHSQFANGGIFDGIWFSLISCTTVGYGDIVPETIPGKFAASLTITFGAMFILLPVLKLVNSFSDALQVTRDLLSSQGDAIEMQPIKARGVSCSDSITKSPAGVKY